MDINNAKVLVTGGSLGIGYAAAKLLIESGAKVVICGRDAKRLEAAAKEIGAVPVLADVSEENDVISLITKTIEALDGYNVLINNAAYGYFSPLTSIDTAKFNEVLMTNITGAMVCGRESAKYFVERGYGNIVNIASSAGTGGFANGSPYCATKFALRGMNECWRAELRKHNIRVMLVNPSEVQTNFGVNAGGKPRDFNPTKLEGAQIAHLIKAMLEMDDKGFIPEAGVWATNPQ
ncbi:MAG TPA: SDR family oxidoreductase [Ignavibacteria bacterium]|nr:SDR family oxidoreductase [Ignavibacteria bacterium]HMQ99377.1 SDR family oxidoreductase [Ignavibacteria bacterium]